MINKAFKIIGIQENSKAQDTLSRMIDYKKQKNETLFLANLESLVESIGGNHLKNSDGIDLRKKLNLITETIVEGKPEKDLSLYETYFEKPTDVSGVETIDKKQFKFNTPEIDTSKILEIKKSEYRWESDKENYLGGLI